MAADVDALLFDLGQVVLNVDFNRAFATWAAFSSVDEREIRNRFSYDEPYKLHEIGVIDHQVYFASLRSSLGVDISDAQFLAGWNAIFVGEMPGISELLSSAAKKLPLYAFSNSNPSHETCWATMYDDVLGTFKSVFVSSTIGLRKPQAAAFEHVVREIGVPAERIVFFDDRPENVSGARSLGLRTIHVMTPDCVANAIAELDL